MEALLGLVLVGGFAYVVMQGTAAAKTPISVPAVGFKDVAHSHSSANDYLNQTRKPADTRGSLWDKIWVQLPSHKGYWAKHQADAPASQRQLQ